jgi:hypothetical protein
MEKKTFTKLGFIRKPFGIFIVLFLVIILGSVLYNNFFSSEKRIAYSLPRYPNASERNIESRGRFPDDRYYTLMDFTTSDSPAKIIDFYHNYFIRNNWQIETSISPSDQDYSEALPYHSTYLQKSRRVDILIKPSLGNVMDSLTRSKNNLNTVSFYIN